VRIDECDKARKNEGWRTWEDLDVDWAGIDLRTAEDTGGSWRKQGYQGGTGVQGGGFELLVML
jgi:hypothetical protein